MTADELPGRAARPAAAVVLGVCLLLSAFSVALDVLSRGTQVPAGESYPAWTLVLAGLALAVRATTCSRAPTRARSCAVHAVASGELILGPSSARRAAAFFAGRPRSAHASTSPFPQLTSREHEILDLLAAGRTNAKIAGALFLSPKTVRNDVSAVSAKLRVSGRVQAISRARDAGWAGDPAGGPHVPALLSRPHRPSYRS